MAYTNCLGRENNVDFSGSIHDGPVIQASHHNLSGPSDLSNETILLVKLQRLQ